MAVYVHDDLLNGLVHNFDPDNNQMDRRLFFEVTGVSLVENEFDDEDTYESFWDDFIIDDPTRKRLEDGLEEALIDTDRGGVR